MRHADAVPEDSWLTDESRYLSEAGRCAAIAAGRELARLGVEPTGFVSSPLVRAVQTAELVALGLGVASSSGEGLGLRAIRVHESLAPGRPLRRLVADLAELEGALLIGHEPSISGLAGALTEQPRFTAFEKAQIVAVEGGRAAWTLLPGDREPRRYAPLNP